MKKLFYLVLILMLVSCKEKDIKPIPTGRGMAISFVDINGSDLLNQDNPDAFDTSVIKIYHQEDGEIKLYSSGAFLDQTDGILYDCDESLCKIGIVLADTNYLWLNKNITDTIYTEANINSGVMTKIWYNGELIWDNLSGEDLYFTIIK